MILDRKKKGALSKMGFKIKDTKTVTYKDGDTEKELTYKDIESFESQVKYILIYWHTDSLPVIRRQHTSLLLFTCF